MCRILAARADNPESIAVVRSLLPYFYMATRRDPRLARAYRPASPSHCHGYGYILAVDYGDGWNLHYTRFDSYPRTGLHHSCHANLNMLEKELARLQSILANSERALLLLHSRRASPGSPRGVMNAHPFHTSITVPGGHIELFLAHNGSVDKTRLARELEINDVRSYTDSYLLLHWIAREIEKGVELSRALQKGQDFVRSAYVVAMMSLGPSPRGPPILWYSVSVPKNLAPEAREYYLPYVYHSAKLGLLLSPTILDYARSDPNLEWLIGNMKQENNVGAQRV